MKETFMRDTDTLPEHQRRHLAHIYAALREHIKDELKYDREPDFAPLDADAFYEMWDQIYAELTELMYAAHAEEAAAITAKGDEAAKRFEEERLTADRRGGRGGSECRLARRPWQGSQR
jgi:hypothetical protein